MVGALLVRRQRVKDVADRLERGIADGDDVIKRSVLRVPGFRAFPAAELAIEVLHGLFRHIQLAVRRQLLEEFPGLQSLTGVVHHGHVVGENVQILRSTGFAVACLIQKGRPPAPPARPRTCPPAHRQSSLPAPSPSPLSAACRWPAGSGSGWSPA